MSSPRRPRGRRLHLHRPVTDTQTPFLFTISSSSRVLGFESEDVCPPRLPLVQSASPRSPICPGKCV